MSAQSDPVGVSRFQFSPGVGFVHTASSPTQPIGVVFEDDGDTGYLYAVNLMTQPQEILDALLVYTVKGQTRTTQSAEIQWSVDGTLARLVIDGRPEALFDFGQRQGYCRSGFPSPGGQATRHGWSQRGHAWSNDALDNFK